MVLTQVSCSGQSTVGHTSSTLSRSSASMAGVSASSGLPHGVAARGAASVPLQSRKWASGCFLKPRSGARFQRSNTIRVRAAATVPTTPLATSTRLGTPYLSHVKQVEAHKTVTSLQPFTIAQPLKAPRWGRLPLQSCVQ